MLLLTAAALAVFLAAAALRAERSVDVQMTDNAAATIHLTDPGLSWDGLGFVPIAVKIENRAATARTWTIAFDSGSQVYASSGAGVLHSSFSFTVPAGGTQETVVFVPGPGVANHGYSANVQASVSGPGVSQRTVSWFSALNLAKCYVAVSPGQETAARTFFGVGSSTSSGSSRRGDVELGAVEPARWPGDWRTWSPFSVVVLGADEFAALDATRRAALRDWAALGGTLVLSPTSAQPAANVEKIGLGQIISLPESLAALNGTPPVPAPAPAPARGRRGGGVSGSPRPPSAPGGQLQNLPLADGTTLSLNLIEAGKRTGTPWAGRFQLLSDPDRKAREIESSKLLPALFLLVFAVIVGPINIFVLAPAGRRHRLFVTVPLLSLVASLGLGASIFLSDGVGGAGTRRALVLLLPGENKAVVAQEQVTRTGLLLGHGFALPADTLATPIVFDAAEGGPGRLERTGDAANGEWFRSRARQGQTFERLVPTRARVELVGKDPSGAPIVQSSLTTTLRDFYYLDANGGAWGADAVESGHRVTLHAVDRALTERQFNGQAFRSDNGWFYAHGGPGDLAPLATLPAIKWSDDSSVLYTGRLEAAHP